MVAQLCYVVTVIGDFIDFFYFRREKKIGFENSSFIVYELKIIQFFFDFTLMCFFMKIYSITYEKYFHSVKMNQCSTKNRKMFDRIFHF